jgi:hypothetical protein
MYNGKSIDKFTAEELVKRANENHIWINAFDCINPSPQFLQNIGSLILQKLHTTDMSDSLGISPTIILVINKS